MSSYAGKPWLPGSNGWVPPTVPDLTDANLPRRCELCKGWLPLANKWSTEEDEDLLVAYFQCVKCQHVNTVTLATRGC
jgi:hypothetical protein